MAWREYSGAAKAAAILGVLSLAVRVTSLRTSSSGGMRSCSFMDYGALGFGALAVLAGLGALFLSGDAEKPGLSRLVGAIALLIGLWRMAYGAGMVGGPC
ncbi:MAG: hypothetical protein KDK12_11930 [Rhodobacteraceae bacterium]|nr:hypothetical protein [Paracoccaceae bacterium]